MLLHALSTFAVMAYFAGHAIAEPMRQPYKPTEMKLAKMSARQIFGLDRRDDDGYAPEQQFCGSGDTCAEACGKGFEQCKSNDGVVHCFNKGAKQTCCPGLTGDSCDEGYFCSADDKGATWCCPDSMNLKQCAAAYNLPGSLVPDTTPGPTSTSTSRTSTATAATTTKNDAPVTTPNVPTTTSSTESAPSATTSGYVTVNGGTNRGPVGGLALVVAAVFAGL
ncbi:hypothetical protein F4779DRAFT_9892 [Xylariaceae sp. FL0662B]|nr:hypothetical protein F4779DRAFT_9892 [Xylariaceae sp. FL0662B]